MSDLPGPLVPANVDLRDFAYMPLDVARLRDSDLAALVSAEAFRAAVILWCAAWHQVPAGSLPPDDQALARLAGFGRDLIGWKKTRDEALRGFVLCSDGRLYHPVIAEKALFAWDAKQAQRARTAAATAARLAKKASRNEDRNEHCNDQRDVVRDVERNVTRHVPPDENVTFTKGKGKGKGDSNSVSLRSTETRAALDAFEREFWPRYPNKVGKPAAQRSFEKLHRDLKGDIAPIIAGLERYVRDKPVDRPWLNPATFLNQRRFDDQPAAPQSAASQPTPSAPRIDFGGGVCWPETSVIAAIRRFQTDPTSWPADRIGPPPGASGCRIPDDVVRRAA